MRPADEAAEALDLLLDQLQHHAPERGARHAGVDPEIARVIRELHLLATATPIPHGLVQELGRRLAQQVDSLVTAQPGAPAGTLLDVRGHVAAMERMDGGADVRVALDQGQSTPELALPEVLPYLLGRSGHLSAPQEDGPALEVWLERGRVVDASWGRLRALSALEMAAVLLPRARYTFTAGARSPTPGFELSLTDLWLRLAQVVREGATLREAIPGPWAVPSMVPAARPPNDPEAARLLSRIDGQRSVAELVEGRQPLVVLRGLAGLAALGAITFEPEARATAGPKEETPHEVTPAGPAPTEEGPGEEVAPIGPPAVALTGEAVTGERPTAEAPTGVVPRVATQDAEAAEGIPHTAVAETAPAREPRRRRSPVPLAALVAALLVVLVLAAMRAFPLSPAPESSRAAPPPGQPTEAAAAVSLPTPAPPPPTAVPSPTTVPAATSPPPPTAVSTLAPAAPTVAPPGAQTPAAGQTRTVATAPLRPRRRAACSTRTSARARAVGQTRQPHRLSGTQGATTWSRAWRPRPGATAVADLGGADRRPVCGTCPLTRCNVRGAAVSESRS